MPSTSRRGETSGIFRDRADRPLPLAVQATLNRIHVLQDWVFSGKMAGRRIAAATPSHESKLTFLIFQSIEA